MKKTTIYFSVLISALLYSCSNDKKSESDSNESKSTEVKEEPIKPFCADSEKEKTLRLEVKCENCEVKYSLIKDAGKEENKENVQGVWCKELTAEPTDYIGLFATKLENGKPIEFTLESIKFKEGVVADTVEVRTYYNNKLIKQSSGNGYAGISMLEIPQTKFEESKPLDLNECIGKNVFDIVQKHSKSSPETLTGTSNEYWIVYYKDIDVTFTVKKKNDIIEKAEKGKK